ncbi:hypothetical protein FN846DRAFT_914842 [Sphaerosporella brunnea]|uniref:Uncharacterized protein n=1 Tax=Sphaerosporella brunnea TaxID=1250544 RepID=A0A5J5ECM6_9PEZI|nr:hypothetical protein FN846DRAFT_914842 [Sphaerosporella brunnea]
MLTTARALFLRRLTSARPLLPLSRRGPLLPRPPALTKPARYLSSSSKSEPASTEGAARGGTSNDSTSETTQDEATDYTQQVPDLPSLLRHPSYSRLFRAYPNAREHLRKPFDPSFFEKVLEHGLSEQESDDLLITAGHDLARSIISRQDLEDSELWELEEELVGTCVRGLVEGVFRLAKATEDFLQSGGQEGGGGGGGIDEL